MYQQKKSPGSTAKFRQANNSCKSVLKGAKLGYGYANKTKESITPQKLDSHNFWLIANSISNKVKTASCPLFNGPGVLFPTSDKLFAKTFPRNSNQVSLYLLFLFT